MLQGKSLLNFLFMTKLNHNHVLVFLLLVLSFLYYLSSCYINTSNDGSHFALVSALVKNNTVSINEYVHYTGKIDYATKNGVYYSDRLPGNAFLMIPFFLFGSLLEFLHLDVLSEHRPIQEVTVIFLPNLCGVLAVFYIYLLSRTFGATFKRGILMSLLYGLCTLNVQESTHVFSHAPSMCLVLMAFYYLIKMPSIYHSQFLLFVFLCSLSLLVELQNGLLFFPALFYILQSKKINLTLYRKNFWIAFLSLLIIASFISVLLAYNYIAFGEITLKSNKYNPVFPEEVSFLTSLSGDFVSGMDRLFTNFLNREVWFDLKLGTQNDIPGLFVTSPILVLSLFGFYLFVRKYAAEGCLFIFIIFIHVLIASLHKTVLTRHIFTITPFLFFPLLLLLQYARANFSKVMYVFFQGIVVIFSGYSCFRVFYVTHSYWGRDISNILPFQKEVYIYGVYLLFIMPLLYFYLRRRNSVSS